MKKDSQQIILKIILILSILGLFTSLYLVQNHYSTTTGGAFCDLSESVSCSLVNTSIYSVLLNVPVAVFGALWFIILGALAWKSLKNKKLIVGIVGWNIFGLIFVVYLIIAEILLQAICPFCTVVHVITIITFILSLILYKQQKKISAQKIVNLLRPWVVLIVILNLIPLILFNIPTGEKIDYSELTQCITEKGVNMYGSFRCGICAKQRLLLGDAFQYINEIECHPQGENPQTELCVSKKLKGTPTWILEPQGKEIKRVQGFMSIEELKEFSGCEFEVTKDAS